jgi:PleD family two-component response regulator
MKILVIDRDEVLGALIKSRLEPVGHRVTLMPSKPDGLEKIASQDFDLVFIDPSPQTNPKPMIVNLRRQIRYNPYMVLLSDTFSFSDALSHGLNDLLIKPVDPKQIDLKVENAARLSSIMKQMMDTSEDFPSAGGIISKSAFHQLFLSCIDRADRYGERSFALYISIANYRALCVSHGQDEADIAVARLAQHLVRLRRSSDIIGQTRIHEFGLLLLRPNDDQEPVEAANRFADTLSRYQDLAAGRNMQVELNVSLIDLPCASLMASHSLQIKSREVA